MLVGYLLALASYAVYLTLQFLYPIDREHLSRTVTLLSEESYFMILASVGFGIVFVGWLYYSAIEDSPEKEALKREFEGAGES
jgi:hypothetical protein